jgi:hypothetical protein
MRESSAVSRERLLAIRESARAYRDDWLLAAEVGEMLGAAERPPEARA